VAGTLPVLSATAGLPSAIRIARTPTATSGEPVPHPAVPNLVEVRTAADADRQKENPT
jgi:hypothetical protein